ncbi:MAG: GNAT family N-acetyltransferase [Anaerolineaceae bacterium]|nr:GNAT family N-acetyltransferase [Anaerolineaceae bacterium]MDD4042283.1 GNAT family N-acetyltransferase [Anaerolineaceae bacterium]MDD4577905.1 GNAT family N-acetyltransferase [Anaerolineaceae bacterium]
MTEFIIEYNHFPDRKEIVALNELGDVVGEIDYYGTDDFWSIVHTGVRPAYRGGPIARTLVRMVVEAAREAGVKLGATCSYAIKVLEETPEYSDVYDSAE